LLSQGIVMMPTSPISSSVQSFQDWGIPEIRNLLAAGAKGEALDQAIGDVTPLYSAIHIGDVELVKQLLHAGASPNLVSAQHIPLQKAIIWNKSKNKLGIVEALCEAGARIPRNRSGDASPLIAAATRGYWDVAEYLLLHGANPNDEDGYGTTILGCALQTVPPISFVELLLKQGADPHRGEWWQQPLATVSGNLSRPEEERIALAQLLRQYEKEPQEYMDLPRLESDEKTR